METIRCLELFKAVVNHKSFCKAAAANHLPPESVTRAVQKLETELGVSGVAPVNQDTQTPLS